MNVRELVYLGWSCYTNTHEGAESTNVVDGVMYSRVRRKSLPLWYNQNPNEDHNKKIRTPIWYTLVRDIPEIDFSKIAFRPNYLRYYSIWGPDIVRDERPTDT